MLRLQLAVLLSWTSLLWHALALQNAALNRRELFTTSAAAAAALTAAPVLAFDEQEGYDLSLERIWDTKRGSYLPADPRVLFKTPPKSPVVCIGETDLLLLVLQTGWPLRREILRTHHIYYGILHMYSAFIDKAHHYFS